MTIARQYDRQIDSTRFPSAAVPFSVRHLLLLLWTATVPWLVQADEVPPRKTPSPPALDDQLLEGLKGRPPKANPGPGAAIPPLVPPMDPPSGPSNSEEKGTSGDDPFSQLFHRMQAASKRLASGDSSDATRQIQQGIADELGQLIEQLSAQRRNAPSSSTGGSSSVGSQSAAAGNTSRPGGDSNAPGGGGQPSTAGDPGEIAPENVATGKNIWGHLPRRVREQIQASAIEEFLPKYQELIEAYYRRLAEEADSTSP